MPSTFTLFGAFTTQPGRAAELISIMQSGQDMNTFPGCREYRIFTESTSPDKVWVFESWESEDAHKLSLQDPAIKALISQAMPLIAGMSDSHILTPAE